MHLTICERIDAPVERVFEVFADFPNAARHVDGIEKIEMLTSGPVGVGTRFRETRIMFGRPSTEEMKVTEFSPSQRYTVTADSCGAHFESTFRFTSQGDATQVDMELNTRANSLFAKLMSPLGLFMMGSMKRMMEADIQQLKSHCEAGFSGAGIGET